MLPPYPLLADISHHRRSTMSNKMSAFSRRRFLKAAAGTGALLVAPQFIPAAALGKDGNVAPSEKIVIGGIGIGNRGTYDLGCFLQEPDVKFVAICDVKAARREAVKKMADAKYGNKDCATYRDLRELLARGDIDAVLIATGPNWHATASMLAAEAGKDVYCEKPCTRNIVQSLTLAETFRRTGPRVPSGHAAAQHARISCSPSSWPVAGNSANSKRFTPIRRWADVKSSGWAAAEPEPPKDELDWDLYLGPAAWRPFNKTFLTAANFEKGGGMVGGGVLEWGSHCVDLCQWAADADGTAPVEYNPMEQGRAVARYASGVKLVIRSRRMAPARLVPGAVRRRRGLGRGGRQRQARAQFAALCWPAGKWRKSTDIRPPSTSAISSTA